MLNIKINSKAKLTKEELEAKSQPKKGGQWIKDVGEFDLTIDSVTNKNKKGAFIESKDPAWATVIVTYSNSKGQKITDLLNTPIDASGSFSYNRPGKEPDFRPLQRVCAFLEALGVQIEDHSKILGTIDHFFGANMEANLIGKTVKANVQYKGLNVRYMGKNDEGATQYQLHNWENPYQIREGEVAPILTGYPACENHAVSLGLNKDNISPFPSIKDFIASKNAVQTDAVVENDEDMPF
jgi:hypothetical protein